MSGIADALSGQVTFGFGFTKVERGEGERGWKMWDRGGCYMRVYILVCVERVLVKRSD